MASLARYGTWDVSWPVRKESRGPVFCLPKGWVNDDGIKKKKQKKKW